MLQMSAIWRLSLPFSVTKCLELEVLVLKKQVENSLMLHFSVILKLFLFFTETKLLELEVGTTPEFLDFADVCDL